MHIQKDQRLTLQKIASKALINKYNKRHILNAMLLLSTMGGALISKRSQRPEFIASFVKALVIQARRFFNFLNYSPININSLRIPFYSAYAISFIAQSA